MQSQLVHLFHFKHTFKYGCVISFEQLLQYYDDKLFHKVLLSPIVCYFRDVYPFIYLIITMYVNHLGLYCILFRRFLISRINIVLQFTKL